LETRPLARRVAVRTFRRRHVRGGGAMAEAEAEVELGEEQQVSGTTRPLY
jgi:hypothetical protein